MRAARPFSLLCAFAAAMMGVAVLASASRGGLASLAIGLVVVGVIATLARRRHVRVGWTAAAVLGTVGIAIVVGALWLTPRTVFNRVNGDDDRIAGRVWDSFYESRGWIWANTVRVIADRPLAGSGLGAFATAFRAHGSPEDPTVPGATLVVSQAHNEYLQVLADLGLAGGALALWFLFGLGRAVSRAVRAQDRLLAGLALGCAGGLCALAVHSFFDFNLHIPSHAMLALLLTAVVSRIAHIADAQRTDERDGHSGPADSGETFMQTRHSKAARIARRVAAIALAAFTIAHVRTLGRRTGRKPDCQRISTQQPSASGPDICSRTRS